MGYQIRKGRREDLPQVLTLIKELAHYERALDEVETTVEQLEADGFGPQPLFGFYVAEEEGALLGIALYYYRYSTWKGKSLYLEDIVVTASARGRGIGKQLFDQMVREAREQNCHQVNWQVLDWNEPAINFYNKLGADLDGEWINCRLNKAGTEAYQFS